MSHERKIYFCIVLCTVSPFVLSRSHYCTSLPTTATEWKSNCSKYQYHIISISYHINVISYQYHIIYINIISYQYIISMSYHIYQYHIISIYHINVISYQYHIMSYQYHINSISISYVISISYHVILISYHIQNAVSEVHFTMRLPATNFETSDHFYDRQL